MVKPSQSLHNHYNCSHRFIHDCNAGMQHTARTNNETASLQHFLLLDVFAIVAIVVAVIIAAAKAVRIVPGVAIFEVVV